MLVQVSAYCSRLPVNGGNQWVANFLWLSLRHRRTTDRKEQSSHVNCFCVRFVAMDKCMKILTYQITPGQSAPTSAAWCDVYVPLQKKTPNITNKKEQCSNT